MFGVAVKLVPNSAAISLRRVLHRLQHSQPTVFYRRQLLDASLTEFQSNQPATARVRVLAEFDGSLCE